MARIDNLDAMNKQTTRREFLSATSAAIAGGAALAAGKVPAPGQNAPTPAIVSRHPTLAEVDVLVVGAGPAGIGAALGAARKGAKTMLIESHSFFGGVAAWSMGMQMNQMRPGGKYVKMQIHDVPYRAILPEKLDGLLTAGRCISATHAGAAAGKSMGNCIATGHAAGLAAAMSAAKNRLPRELKAAEIQAALRADGVELDAADRRQTWLK
jgi:succinate dehydrogenase/fumarate reductase flavoprotein subunit